MTPRVSVVLPVYNGREYLVDSIASILEQSETDFELIAVNDGSTDGSAQMLDWFASVDSRVRVFHQPNQGLVAALNRGCSASRAEFIMRMDNDDIALPNRMARQIEYLSEHRDCVVCGTGILEMDQDSDPLRSTLLPVEHDEIVHNLLTRRTGHFHPSVVFRRDAFQRAGEYRPEFEWVEDHDLWLRMASQGRLANLPDVMLCYRQHASSICWQRSSLQRTLMNQLLEQAYGSLGKKVPAELILANSANRSPAGPGKWARAAAKGGYRRTALKHLRALQQGSDPLTYRVRMSAEVLGRVGLAELQTRLRSRETIKVPHFEEWHQRWNAARSQKQVA